MTKNKIAYVLIAGILAVGITTASFAVAQPVDEDSTPVANPSPVFKFRMMDSVPEIKGTIEAEYGTLDGAKIGLSEAIFLAELDTSGTAIAASLGAHVGYLTYTVAVKSGETIQTVIVDAGNGEILHVSEPKDISDRMALHASGHGITSGKIVLHSLEHEAMHGKMLITSGNHSTHFFKCIEDAEDFCENMKALHASEPSKKLGRMLVASGNPDAQSFMCTEDGCTAVNAGELAKDGFTLYKQE